MARGTDEKILVQNKILENFEGSFVYGKEIRVPVGDVQIKITLTCAKENVAAGEDIAMPGEQPKIAEGAEPVFEKPAMVEPSEDEISAVSNLMASLGL